MAILINETNYTGRKYQMKIRKIIFEIDVSKNSGHMFKGQGQIV